MAWDKDKPAGSQKIRLSDEEIRANWTALEDALAREHTFPGVLGGTAGEHTPLIANLQKQLYTAAAAGGTVDAITATFVPALAALVDNLLVCVVAAGANLTTTPTFAPDGLAAKTIVKGNNQPLVAGDIPGADYPLLLHYSSSLDKWILLNPLFLGAATQTEQEAGAITTKFTAPGTQQFHPSAAKAWVSFQADGTILASHNVDSPVTKNGTGDWTVTFTTDFSSVNYAAVAVMAGGNYLMTLGAKAAGTLRLYCYTAAGAAVDPTAIDVVCFGDQ